MAAETVTVCEEAVGSRAIVLACAGLERSRASPSICTVVRVDPEDAELVEVDEAVLGELVEVAVRDAHPNEVTPPLSAGEEWTAARVEWLRSFHEDRRGGLLGAGRESTWAVRAGGVVVGAARLKRAASAGSVEAGVWLCRSARGRGIGRRTMVALIEQAASAGAEEVRAETAEGNHAAVAVLRGLGFEISVAGTAAGALPGRPGGRPVMASFALTVSHDATGP